MNLIGRKRELDTLSKLWDKKEASLVAITGRRRIGKSRLIEEFGKTADCYFEIQGLAPSPKMNNQDQIDYFVGEMNKNFKTNISNIKTWQEVFHQLSNILPSSKKTLVFLDEISWMGGHDDTFPSVLKASWDTLFKKNRRLILVVCGSVSSWIEENILNSTDFLGRFSLVLNLEELPLQDLPLFYRNYGKNTSTKEMIEMFSITGGVPRYLEEINPKVSSHENIQNLCFSKNGLLVDEFDRIFNDIFERRQKTYKEIVKSLVHGRKTFAEICKAIKLPRSGAVTKYLKELILSGFLSEDAIYTNGQIKKTKYYRLKDNYLRFYLRYIEPQKIKIKQGLFEDTKLAALKDWSIISGFQFENLILSNLNLVLHALKIEPHEVLSASPFIQKKNSKNKGSCQIDLLIQTKSSTYYLCEIKNRKYINTEAIKEIQNKSKKLYRPKHTSLRTVLIFNGTLADEVLETDEINYLIPIEKLIGRK